MGSSIMITISYLNFISANVVCALIATNANSIMIVAWQTIHVKCQALFFLKKKKK